LHNCYNRNENDELISAGCNIRANSPYPNYISYRGISVYDAV